jgi:hypothetical protein
VSSELNTIGSSKGPWVLYEIMPIDSHTLLTKDAEAEAGILKLLPEASCMARYTQANPPRPRIDGHRIDGRLCSR